MPAVNWPATAIVIGLIALVLSGGCSSLWQKDPAQEDREHWEALLKAPEPPALIREAAVAHGLNYSRIQSFGLVNGLTGTGGIEPPSLQRERVLNEMKTRDVEDPNRVIDSASTAVVMIETWIPPGVRKGDPLDLTIKCSTYTDTLDRRTTSLRGGWLMPTRLTFTRMINGAPRSSNTLAMGAGPVIIDGTHIAGEDPNLLLRGRVIAGGVAQQDGHLDLRIRPEYRHVSISERLANVISRRFYFFDGTRRRGIANAKEDDLIEIEVPERYRHNVHRLMTVIEALGTETDLAVTHSRIDVLAKQLKEPTTAQDAALQLEGIGTEAVPTLLTALGSPNPEIRFYAAEALAYLDHEEAIAPLVELTRDQPAFRFQTLLALSGMKQRRAGEGLRQLLDESSTETRFGAFDAIRRRDDADSIITGKRLRNIAMFYEIPSRGGPLVAISLRRSPDIVQFGGTIKIDPPQSLIFGTGLIMVPAPNGELEINRFQPSKPDAKAVVPASVQGLCIGIVQAGGGYGDIIEALRLLKQQDRLAGQLAIDVLPKPLREYHREGDDTDAASMDPAALPPEPIDPPRVEEEEPVWFDPRGWFGAIDLSAFSNFS